MRSARGNIRQAFEKDRSRTVIHVAFEYKFSPRYEANRDPSPQLFDHHRYLLLDVGIDRMRRMSLLSLFARHDRFLQRIARHSGWLARVNQDDKGSRGVWIMPLMIVAGKLYVSV